MQIAYDKHTPGFTLIELVITTVLVAIMLSAIWMVYNTGFKAFYSQWTRSGIKGELGRASVNISNELRAATAITSAQEESLSFTADSDSNGADETIQYTWSGVAGEDLNRVSSVTIPVVHSVSSLSFSYYDSNNNLLSPPVTASQVRLVALDITVAEEDETFQLRSKVKLRSL
jgi:prepilin-type N-terminal cleavage/methylation domain-containing protein